MKRKGRFLYLGFGEGAQPEVRLAMQRFRDFTMRRRASFPSAWGWLLGPLGTPPGKMDRDWIEWRRHPVEGRKCGNCIRHYTNTATGVPLCDSVAGVWPLEWWCQIWGKPISRAEYERYQR